MWVVDEERREKREKRREGRKAEIRRGSRMTAQKLSLAWWERNETTGIERQRELVAFVVFVDATGFNVGEGGRRRVGLIPGAEVAVQRGMCENEPPMMPRPGKEGNGGLERERGSRGRRRGKRSKDGATVWLEGGRDDLEGIRAGLVTEPSLLLSRPKAPPSVSAILRPCRAR